MADTRLVEFNLPAGAGAVLQVDRVISAKEAERIKRTWRETAGRDQDPGTPIFDQLLDERAERLKLVDGLVLVAGSR